MALAVQKSGSHKNFYSCSTLGPVPFSAAALDLVPTNAIFMLYTKSGRARVRACKAAVCPDFTLVYHTLDILITSHEVLSSCWSSCSSEILSARADVPRGTSPVAFTGLPVTWPFDALRQCGVRDGWFAAVWTAGPWMRSMTNRIPKRNAG